MCATGFANSDVITLDNQTTLACSGAYIISSVSDTVLTLTTGFPGGCTGDHNNQTLTIGTGLAYSPGQSVIVAYDGSNEMQGTVTSYNSGTGQLVVNVTTEPVIVVTLAPVSWL